MQELRQLRKEIQKIADPKKAKVLQGFFKTDEGEYGAGDVFVGLTVPQSRQLAKKYQDLPLQDIETLLTSKIHEERLIALFLLIKKFETGNEEMKKQIYDFYLANTKYINNWDLVDTSAGYIVGGYLWGHGGDGGETSKEDSPLMKLAKSESIWERRIAMLSTFAFIRKGEPDEVLKIAEILVHDEHDLIQKAVGWMLREIGKRCSEEAEEAFLKKYYQTMPRTMLRYAIERFAKEKREAYLTGSIETT